VQLLEEVGTELLAKGIELGRGAAELWRWRERAREDIGYRVDRVARKYEIQATVMEKGGISIQDISFTKRSRMRARASV
jgi:hypothetical protein